MANIPPGLDANAQRHLEITKAKVRELQEKLDRTFHGSKKAVAAMDVKVQGWVADIQRTKQERAAFIERSNDEIGKTRAALRATMTYLKHLTQATQATIEEESQYSRNMRLNGSMRTNGNGGGLGNGGGGFGNGPPPA
jgi:hypothetical protein